MSEYSEDIVQEIQETVDKWCDDFAVTNLFKNLPKTAQENAGFIISVFGEKMYDYPGETPAEWSAEGLSEVITDVFPRKISADEETFMSVESVLTAFFQYLNDRGYIKNANKLIKALKEAAPIMVEQATDSSNWGFAKQFVMAAFNEGVDIEDKQAMDKFTQKYNAQITSSPTFAAPQIGKSMPKVGRNELCPCGSGKKFKKCCGKNA